MIGFIGRLFSGLEAWGPRHLLNLKVYYCRCLVLVLKMLKWVLLDFFYLKLAHFAFVRAFVFILVSCIARVAAIKTLLYEVRSVALYKSLSFCWASDN